jgi:hypothetical protein
MMNNWIDGLSTMLIDQHLQELRAEAARSRLIAEVARQRRERGASCRVPRWTGGLFFAALTRPMLEPARLWRWAMPHRDCT